jgi:hypothetical protein
MIFNSQHFHKRLIVVSGGAGFEEIIELYFMTMECCRFFFFNIYVKFLLASGQGLETDTTEYPSYPSNRNPEAYSVHFEFALFTLGFFFFCIQLKLKKRENKRINLSKDSWF